MYRYFIIIAIIILILITKAYIKINSPFWSTMPVYNTYNILFWFGGPREINNAPPEKDKWCNDKDIIVKKFAISHLKKKIYLLILSKNII